MIEGRDAMVASQPQPTKAEEIQIPANVAKGWQNEEDLDRFVKSEAQRSGIQHPWVRLSADLAFQIGLGPRLSGKSATGTAAVAVPAGAAAIGGICRASDGGSANPINTTTRRSALSRVLRGGGAIAFALLMGRRLGTREALAACHTCYYCDEYCYFSQFYGTYVRDVYYYYATSCYGGFCGLLRYYFVDCSQPHIINSQQTFCS
jgi:hypothetical protein